MDYLGHVIPEDAKYSSHRWERIIKLVGNYSMGKDSFVEMPENFKRMWCPRMKEISNA